MCVIYHHNSSSQHNITTVGGNVREKTKMQNDEMEGLHQLLNSLPVNGVVAQLALGEDLEEECFSD